MYEKNFAELFCEKRGVSPDKFVETAFKLSLYPHARMVLPLFKLIWPDHFASDLEFVASAGQLRRFREFTFESEEYAHHPANRGFWRVTANMRVSSRRLRRLVRTTLHPELSPAEKGDDHSSVPFGGVEKKTVGRGADVNHRMP